MPKNNLTYRGWLEQVDQLVNLIIHQGLSELHVPNFRPMYLRGTHPYYAAIRTVVMSKEYAEGRIYTDFVITEKDKTTLIRATC